MLAGKPGMKSSPKTIPSTYPHSRASTVPNAPIGSTPSPMWPILTWPWCNSWGSSSTRLWGLPWEAGSPRKWLPCATITSRGLILVDAAGIKPVKGEIAEIFMVSTQTRLKQRFYDPSQVPNYERYTRPLTPEEQALEHANREMASRLCWRPYLHNLSLPHYLRHVPTPTLIVWGRQDAIVPLECGELFQQALPNATLKVIEHCGHSPANEKPQEFVHVVSEFLAGLR